jgi:hypothetical protein
MRHRLFSIVCIWVAAAGLACADSLPAGRWDPAAGQCAREITLMHGVWRPGQGFLPAYADLELVVYLASLQARHPGVAVIPVFTSEPVYFRSNHVVFLSTGLILRAESERELTDAIRAARVEAQTRDLPACAATMTALPTSFADVQRRLAGQVAGYGDASVRRLRSRGAARGEKSELRSDGLGGALSHGNH